MEVVLRQISKCADFLTSGKAEEKDEVLGTLTEFAESATRKWERLS